MTNQRHPEQLAAWIRANQGSFTREALERSMREQGWTPEEIAAAWRLVEGAGSPWTDGVRRQVQGARRTELILLLVLLVPVTALAVFFEASVGAVNFGPQGRPILLAALAVTIAIPALVVVAVMRRAAPLGCVGLLGVGLVASLAVFGTCVYSLSNGVM